MLAAPAACLAAQPPIAFAPGQLFPLAGAGAGDRIVAGDFDGDTHTDLAVTPDLNAPESFPNVDGLNLLFGDGLGLFPGRASFLGGEYLTDMASADLNGDGMLDLVLAEGFDASGLHAPVGICASTTPKVPVFLGTDSGTFSLQSPCLTAGRRPGALVIGDFNEDGARDLIVTISTTDVNTVDMDAYFLPGNGDGTFRAGTAFTTAKSDSLATADLNADGHLDLAIGSSSGIHILLGAGNGSFSQPALGLAIPAKSVAIGDINGDGAPDLAAVGSNPAQPADDRAWFALGRGDGTFAAGPYLNVAATSGTEVHPVAVAIADLNRDGFGDLLVANQKSNELVIYLAAADGSFQQQRFAAGNRPTALAVVDLNGDNYPDVALPNYNPDASGTPQDGSVTVLLQQPPVAPGNHAPAPAAISISTPEDTTATSQITHNDPDAGDTHSHAIATAPLHGTASVSASGLATYSPAANYTGADSFVVRVADQFGAFGQVTVPVMVAPVNDAPAAANDGAITAGNTAATLDVLANDHDIDGTLNPASVMVTVLPMHGNFSVNTATGAITYTPAAGYAGTDNFSYSVRDNLGALSNTANVSITVNSVNHAPVAANSRLAIIEDTPKTGALIATDADTDPLSFSLATLPAKGTVALNAGTGTYIYTPRANAYGIDSFSFRANDGSLTSNTGQVMLLIAAINDAPVAVNDGTITSANTPVTIAVLTNDSDVDGTLNPASVTMASLPAHGSVSVNATTGAITYTPAAAYVGSDRFSYSVKDNLGAASNSATVIVFITSPNRTPSPTAAPIATPEDTAATRQVAHNDPDTGDTHTYSIAAAPMHGTASISSGGLLTYAPPVNFFGRDLVIARVTDNAGSSATVNIPIIVSAVNDAPVAAIDSASTIAYMPVTIAVLQNDLDMDGTLDPASVVIASAPAVGTARVNTTTGTITYTPEPSYSGMVNFTYTAKDNLGAVSNSATISISVLPNY